MAGKFSDYLDNQWISHLLEGTPFGTPGTSIYVGLSQANPTDTAAGIAEPVGNNYQRVQFTNWTAPANRLTENAVTITFNQASGSWGTITHWFISDALSGGEMICYGDLTSSHTIVAFDTPEIQAGALEVFMKPSTDTTPVGGLTDYVVHAMLNHTFRNIPFAQPVIHCGCVTADIVDTDTGATITEVLTTGGTNYQRVRHGTWAQELVATNPLGPQWDNTGEILFSLADAPWGTLQGKFLADGDVEGAGQLIWYGNFPSGQEVAINANQRLRIPDGDFDCRLQ
jgi:hypothetical protein